MVQHGYQVIVGQSIVVVAGPLVVDQKVLRAAAAKVRPATPAELNALGFPGEVVHRRGPGYVAHARGIPHGVTLEPSDPAAAPQSMLIDVFVDSSQDPCGGTLATCTPDSDGLQYRRTEDMHGYVVRRGDLNVYAMGGVGVDRALLRRAALNALAGDGRGTAALPATGAQQGPSTACAAGCAAEAAPHRTGGHEERVRTTWPGTGSYRIPPRTAMAMAVRCSTSGSGRVGHAAGHPVDDDLAQPGHQPEQQSLIPDLVPRATHDRPSNT